MQVFITLTSPFARKARILVEEGGIPCELIVANPWENDPRILKANPLRKIPVLLLDIGSVLIDSRVICEYLNDNFCEGRFLPKEIQERSEILSLSALADGITDAAAGLVMAKKVDSQFKSESWSEWQKEKAVKALSYFNNNLGKLPAPPGEHFSSLAEISLACALGYLDFRSILDWRIENTQLAGWFEQVSGLYRI